jgi:hypothetical protein
MKPRTAILLLLALALGGCLKAREVDRILYAPEKDEFHFAMVLENIDSDGTTDMEYLDALRKNKDHLIAPVIPGNAFGFGPWFLRLSEHKAAKVTFMQPRDGDMNPIDVKTSLNDIAIHPGAFFVQNNRLCYYHAMTIPGKTIDAIITQSRRDQLGPLKKAVKSELDRRKMLGRVYTWDELIQQEINAVRSGSTDHPIKPFMVMEEASLNQLVTAAADPKKGFTRKGKDFSVTLPVTPADRDGAVRLWNQWQKTADTAAEQKKSDPILAMQRLPAKAMSVQPVPEGIILSLDILKMYTSFAEASLSFLDSKSPPKPPAQPTFEIRYAKEHNWPLEPSLTTTQILADFAAGKLQTTPSPTITTPGDGLKVQPKK